MGRRSERKTDQGLLPTSMSDDMDDAEKKGRYYRIPSFFYIIVSICVFFSTLDAFKTTESQKARTGINSSLMDSIQHVSNFVPTDKQPATGEKSKKNGPDNIVYTGYKPAPTEAWVMSHKEQLGLANPNVWAPTCPLLTDPAKSPIYQDVNDFVVDLVAYYQKLSTFHLPIRDLRKNLTETDHSVCELLKLHPDGLPGMFAKSKQLSFASTGWIEPLMPFMRHPKICYSFQLYLMNIDYMVHDFEFLCRKMKPTSKTVFVDMGGSLSYFGVPSPVLKLLDLYKKFGIKFDHIYAYELSPQRPEVVFEQLPEEYQAAYHWINVGVAAEKNSRKNPFKMLKDNFEEDDVVIIKLDIDTPELERELAEQLKNDPQLAKLIDHFYFEHHVYQSELQNNWHNIMTETVAESLELFTQIREKGIPIHYWV